jgi:plastocyanin domain-containing protein
MTRASFTRVVLPAVAVALLASPSRADDAEFTLVIKDHQFQPAELEVPAGRKLRLVIDNQDPSPEEFESYDLDREKAIPANGRIVVFVGPLQPGRYEFFGELNMATANGALVAR